MDGSKCSQNPVHSSNSSRNWISVSPFFRVLAYPPPPPPALFCASLSLPRFVPNCISVSHRHDVCRRRLDRLAEARLAELQNPLVRLCACFLFPYLAGHPEL